MWGWGLNDNGQIAQNNTVSRSSPVQIGALTNWLSVSSGYRHCLALKTDGTMWAWGKNSVGGTGSLGDNTTINRSSPVQIGSEYNWAKASVGNNHMVALKTDGTIWGWGENSGGNYGQNNVIHRSSPVQIGALTSWSKLESGARFVLAIKEGTLWAWGLNGGRCGTNTTDNISSPTQVGSLSTWLNVAGGGVIAYGILSV